MEQHPTLYGFRFATGDVNYLDYGGTWVRQISETAFHFVRLINWEDSVGEREAREIGAKYNMQLVEVDTGKVPQETAQSALDSCGDTRQPAEVQAEHLALMLSEYGTYAPLQDQNTSNFHKTFRELARYSREVSANQWVHDAAMKRQVNRIGSTAEEFMRGDLESAIDRGLLRGDRNSQIMDKMRKACESE